MAWHLLRLRSPNNSALAPARYEVFDRYVEWLEVPEVLGLATRDMSQKPVATPTLDQVLTYDIEIRKKVAWHMGRGVDLRTAFVLATCDEKLHRTAFLIYVSLEIASGKCRAISAPGMMEVPSGVTEVGLPQEQKRPLEDAGGGLTKAQMNKIKQ